MAGAVDNKFFSEFWPALSGQERALIRSQTRPLPPCRFLPCPRTDSRGSTLSASACSSFADSTFPSLCPHACADVASSIGPRAQLAIDTTWHTRTGADNTNLGGACICSTKKRAYSPKRETSWSHWLPRRLGKLLSCSSLP